MNACRWIAVGLLAGAVLCDVGIGNAALSDKLLFWAVWVPLLLLSIEAFLRPGRRWLHRVHAFTLLAVLFTVLSQLVQQWAPGPKGKWEFPATALDWLLPLGFVVVGSLGFCGVVALLALAWRKIRPAGSISSE